MIVQAQLGGGSGSVIGEFAWLLAGNNTAGVTKKLGTTSNDDVAITTSNITTGTWFKSGEWGIGITASPLAKLHVRGTGNTAASSINFFAENSDSTQNLSFLDGGYIGRNGGVFSIRAGTNTTSWGANAGLAANGLNTNSVYLGYFAGANSNNAGVIVISGDSNNNISADYGAGTTSIGNGALIGATGEYNVAYGVSAGSRTTTGGACVYIGSYADGNDSSDSLSNKTGNYNIIVGSVNLGGSAGTSFTGGNAFSSVFAVHGIGTGSNQMVFGGGIADTYFTSLRVGYSATGAIHGTYYRTSTPAAAQAASRGSVAYVDDGTDGELFVKTAATDSSGWGQVVAATAVTTEVLVPDTSLTIKINGTVYKILARA